MLSKLQAPKIKLTTINKIDDFNWSSEFLLNNLINLLQIHWIFSRGATIAH